MGAAIIALALPDICLRSLPRLANFLIFSLGESLASFSSVQPPLLSQYRHHLHYTGLSFLQAPWLVLYGTRLRPVVVVCCDMPVVFVEHVDLFPPPH